MKVPVSFEFYPPKTDEQRAQLNRTAERLARYAPEYVSCTFGAGGSTQEGTLDTVREIVGEGLRIHQAAAADFERRTWASSAVSAPGVTPSMRPACPSVRGRTRASFSRTSFDSPPTAA